MTTPKRSAEDVANQIVDFINKEFYKAPVQESGTRWVLLQPGLIEILTQYAEEKVKETMGKCPVHEVYRGRLCSICVVNASRAEALEECRILCKCGALNEIR